MQNIKFYCIAGWIEEGTRARDSGCSKVSLALEFQTINTNLTQTCAKSDQIKKHWLCSDNVQVLLAHNQSISFSSLIRYLLIDDVIEKN